MSNSYYKNIDGKNYDREMLEIADEAVAGVGDGRISVEDAQKLLGAVKDANKYTDIEKSTMKYIRENYKFTYASDQWFRKEIRKWAATKGKDNNEKSKPIRLVSQTEFIPSKSYYKIIDGEHYVRSLLDSADERLEGKGNGLISEEDFQQIIELSRNGKGITETEMRTLEYIGQKYNLTTKARLWFEENLGEISSEVIKSDQSSENIISQVNNKANEELIANEEPSEKEFTQATNKANEEFIASEEPSEKEFTQATNKANEEITVSDSYENKKSTEYMRPIMNENHNKSLLLVHVLWAVLLLISIITVRSIFIDQVADAEQNLERLIEVSKNNNLLQEELKSMQIEKNMLESELKGFDQSMNEQLIKQKKLEAALSLEESQAIKKTNSEVIAFKPDQNNCCYCSCENNVIDD